MPILLDVSSLNTAAGGNGSILMARTAPDSGLSCKMSGGPQLVLAAGAGRGTWTAAATCPTSVSFMGKQVTCKPPSANPSNHVGRFRPDDRRQSWRLA